jgi:hypothetical protein
MQLSKLELQMISGSLNYFITRAKELKLDEDLSDYENLKAKIDSAKED